MGHRVHATKEGSQETPTEVCPTATAVVRLRLHASQRTVHLRVQERAGAVRLHSLWGQAEALRERVELAVRSCPRNALSLEG